MSDEVEDPAQAARVAVQGQTQGSDPTPQGRQTGSQGPDSGGSAGSSARRSTLRDYLHAAMDADAEGPNPDDLQGTYGLRKPQALIMRGVLRIAGCVRMPPLGDITLGGLLWASDGDESGSSDDGDRDDRADDEPVEQTDDEFEEVDIS